MSCSQVFLTYKRKRLTGTGPARGNGCDSSLSTGPIGNSFTSLKLHDDLINKKTFEEDQNSKEHFLGNEVLSEGRLSSDSMGTAISLTIDAITLKSSFERKDSLDCDDDTSCRLKALTSENHISLAEDNNTVCSGLVKETRSSTPLITFIRKNKRKRDMDGSDAQRKLLLVDKSGSLANKYQKGYSKGHETDLKPAVEVVENSYSSCLIEDKVTVVDSTPPHARVSPETEILIIESERQHDGESTSENVLNVAEQGADHSAQDVVHICKDLPIFGAPLGNTMKDSTSEVLNDVSQKEEIHACKREESETISNDGKKAKIGGLRPFLDLSVTPTDSSGALYCNINMDSHSQIPSFYGKSHTEMSDVRNERRPSFPSKMQTDATAGVERVFLEESSSTCKNNDTSNSVSMNFTCKNKYLQLFPEDKFDENFQMLTTQPHRTAFTAAAEGKTIKLDNKNNKKKTRCPPILGLYPPTEPKGTASTSVNCLTTFPLLNLYGETREFFQDAVPQSSSNNLSSAFRHGILNNILTRSGALNERESFQDNLKSYATSWTEEELDFLWIGVRRHGVDNWGAMLKDRKLHFSTFRVARDLAERWEVEQSKFFKDICSPQPKHSEVQSCSSNLYNSFSCQTAGSRKEDTEEATRLSLGDVYTCGESNGSRRSCFQSPYLPTNLTDYLQGPFLCPTRDLFVDYRKGKYEEESPNHSKGTSMSDYNPLRTDFPTTSMVRRGNLPHWIKEAVCAYPSGLTQPNILPGVSLSSQPQNLHATHPYFYPFELQSGPRNEMYHLYGGSSRGQCFNGLSGTSHGKAEVRKASSHACRPENVIVINSDASSEETISDDHGARQ